MERKCERNADLAPPQDAPPATWIDWCVTRLDLHAVEITRDPAANSVRRLAYDLFRLLEDGRADLDILQYTAKGLSDESFILRAEQFSDVHPRIENADLKGVVSKAFEAPSTGGFGVYKSAVEVTRAGVVFTAHPTFAMSRPLRNTFAAYACAHDEGAKAKHRNELKKLNHAPDDNLSLFDEHNDALASIECAQGAIEKLNREILLDARARFPKEWTHLTPAPVSLATWVGYDLDGRTDIHWAQTVRIRLEEKSLQLERYAQKLERITKRSSVSGATALALMLRGASILAGEQASLFSGDLDDLDIVVQAADLLTKDEPHRLVSLKPACDALTAMIAEARDVDTQLDLSLLRSEMKAYGLGVARIHLRINAAQVRSALRADFGLEQDAAFMGRTTLAAAAEKVETATHRNVNFASVFLEQMTARRQFMLCAQIVKHIDADTPIRFLIAECEAPATVMGAIYLSRLYGVDHCLDISPLFETPDALERGGRFLERLLDEEAYVSYIRARGRITIQLGFSDSGRFMGQVAADLAIERLQILLARALGDRNIHDVEAVVFNTHGESMGRGGFPGTIDSRLDHLMTPWARARFEREGVKFNAESSFQGGDGFLHFYTDELALSTVTQIFKWSYSRPVVDKKDHFYKDINYSWDFYRGAKSWQEDLFNNADYHVTLSAFAPNLLFNTGSRRSRRQSGVSAGVQGPRSLRAIPHNAILQQLAIPANVAGGIGAGAGGEAERFVDLVQHSNRARGFLKLAENARDATSLPAFRAYAALFDATLWTTLATMQRESEGVTVFKVIADRVQNQDVFIGLSRLANTLAVDLSKFDEILARTGGAHELQERHRGRRALHVLHAIRQALIMRAFTLTASLPAFSKRHEVTREDLIDLTLQLRLEEVIDLVCVIFPANQPEIAALGMMDESADEGAKRSGGYPEIQAGIMQPLAQISQTIREIGVGISHFYGAYG